MRRATFFLLLTCGIPPRLLAQTYSYQQAPNYEVGLQLALGATDGVSTSVGIGARFHYNFNEHVALDSEFIYGSNSLSTGSQASQSSFLTGLRVGQRAANTGVFLRARAGFLHYDAGGGNSLLSRNTFPAFDAGGTLEHYFGSPSRPWEQNMVVRMEMGALIVPYGNATLLPPPPPAIVIPPVASGRLGTRVGPILSVGMGFRF